MKRRILTLILALTLLAPMIPAPARAAETDLEGEIRRQIEEYVATLGKPDAGAARNTLLNHAIFGMGADLCMDTTDAFGKAVLHTNSIQENLAYSLTKAIRYAGSRNLDTLYVVGGMQWYDNLYNFGNYVHPAMPEHIEDANNRTKPLLSYKSTKTGWQFQPNAYDQVMVDVVGSARMKFTFRKTSVTQDTVTYHVEMTVGDDFDFNSGDSAANQFGNILAGMLIDTYSWSVTADFSFTVPNDCRHRSSDYCWTFDKLEAVSDQTQGTDQNQLIKLQSQNTDGTLNEPFYEISETVRLTHDRPWVVEFRTMGGGALCISRDSTFLDNTPFLFKLKNQIQGGYAEEFLVYNPKTKEDETRYNRYLHGVTWDDAELSCKEWHTYRIENRIAPDGTNMAWLLIDDIEFGAMNQYQIHRPNESDYGTQYDDQGTTVDWFNGADLVLNYIGTSNYRLTAGLEIDYIQIWENGEGNEPYSYFVDTAAAPTCEEGGKIVHTCSLCGASWSEPTGEPALGHDWGEGMVTTAPSCTAEGVMTYVCASDPTHTRTEVIPATGHNPVVDAAVGATCTADGLTEGSHCEACGEIISAQETIPATGHSWDGGVMTDRPSVDVPGILLYTCQTCSETRSEEIPYDPQITRLAGENRFETAFLAADEMKAALGVEKFDTIVVASGMDFADALSGSYLAAVKNAPILLASGVDWINDLTKNYIRNNLNPGGTVYILGGESAVPASFETGLEGYTIDRLAGGNRFDTNLKILSEAGVGDKPILVCTGLSFADSLSASATELPILLVWNDLTEGQENLLETLGDSQFYIIGGESAVSSGMEEQLTAYGTVERVAGENRFETSVAIAEKFFDSPESAVLAYAWNFPDGLCGGPLAATLNAPLILTMDGYETQATAYIQNNAISNGIILGGEGLISDSSANLIFGTTK